MSLNQRNFLAVQKTAIRGYSQETEKNLIFFIMSFKRALQRDLDRLYAKLRDSESNYGKRPLPVGW